MRGLPRRSTFFREQLHRVAILAQAQFGPSSISYTQAACSLSPRSGFRTRMSDLIVAFAMLALIAGILGGIVGYALRPPGPRSAASCPEPCKTPSRRRRENGDDSSDDDASGDSESDLSALCKGAEHNIDIFVTTRERAVKAHLYRSCRAFSACDAMKYSVCKHCINKLRKEKKVR